MAFVSNMPDNEEDKVNQPTGGQGPVSPTGGGGGAVHLAPSSAVATVGGGGTAGSGPTAAGGSFASLDKYLTANQGQAAPLTGKITSSINNQYSDLDTANNAAISGLNTKVADAPGYTASNPDVLAQEAANPVSFAGDQGNVKNFQNLLTNSYGGPLSAEGTQEYSNQQNAINNAIATGTQNTTTEAGRKNLLVQNEATPTSGVTALNSAILSQDPNNLSSVESAYKPFNNLLTNLSTGASDVNTKIASEQSDAASSSKAANDAIASQINALNTGITGNLTTAQQTAAAQNAAVNAALKSGNADPSVLSALGINQDQWNTLTAAQKAAATSRAFTSANGQYGANSGTTNVDLGSFNTQLDPNAALTTANTATAGDYQKAQAFQSLLSGLNLNAPQAIINQSTANQAGTAPTDLNTYNYTPALSTAQIAEQTQTAAAQAYVAALEAGADEVHAQQKASEAASQVQLAQNIGTGVGTVAGGVVGSLFGGVGAGPGMVIGGALGTAAGNTSGHVLQGYAKDVQGSSSPQRVADIATAGAATPVIATIQTIKDLFCFHPDTLITMADGSQMPIHKIGVGDITRGGKVLATTRAVSQDFYWYSGVIVTGKHAVKESGTWVRVENSKLGHRFSYLTEIVCNLVTENHRIYASGIEFADEHETDAYESLDLNESLQELNKHAKSMG